MAAFLTTASVMMCPHGGTVKATSSNTRVTAAGAPMLRSTDSFVITGCPFSIGSQYHPCVTVKWVQTAQHSKIGDPTLNVDSLGLCQAGDQAVQGLVSINVTQERVEGT